MKKFFLLLLAIAAGTTGAMADSGIFGGYITLNLNGAGSAFYKLENPADNSTPPFSGVNFGIFNPALGQSFLLTGGEADTYKNSGSNVSASYLNYRIYPTGSPSSFALIAGPAVLGAWFFVRRRRA